MYKVKLTYFKKTGKYYSEGEYETNKGHLFEIFEEVGDMSNKGNLPGLISRNEPSEFLILIDVPNHEHNYPHIIIPKNRVLCY